MDILFIYRSKDSGPSIRRVFEPIERELQKDNHVDSIYLPICTASPMDIYKNIKFVKKYLIGKHYDIIHITGHVHYLAYSLRRYNTVVTVHDLGFFTKYSSCLKHKYLYLFFIHPLKYAKHITYISESSFKETNAIMNISQGTQSVIYNPIAPSFTYSPKNINKNSPTILHLGTKVNKNLPRVIEAVSALNCKLHIIGQVSNDLTMRLKELNIDYIIDYNISDEEIIEAYKQCDIVCFPSLYEGFGMPIIEGQAIGRPVLTSNREPMQKIAGKGAVFVEPESIESISDGIVETIDKADLLIQEGVENAKRFSIEEISRQYIQVYNKLK